MKLKILLFTIILLVISVFKLNAQDSHNVLTFTGGLSFEKSYNIELAYHYKPTPNLGIGGAVGCWKTFSDFGSLLSDFFNSLDDDYYYDGYSYDDGDILRPYLKASIVGFTPDLYKSENFNIRLGLTMHVMINPTFTREIKYERPNGQPELIEDFESRWYSWGGELGVDFYDDEFGIGLGYSISTLELKTMIDFKRRAILANQFIHGVFLRLYFGI